MKYDKAEDSYLFIQLINDENLEKLNKIFGTNYTRKKVANKVRVSRKEDFNFFDKLMKQKSRSRL